MVIQEDIREKKNPKESNKEYCGNNICEQEENCYDCPKDCKCSESEYCPLTEKNCVKPICGDGTCEPYENPFNCCLDCTCILPEEICNEQTKKCEMEEIKINLSDNEAIETVADYFDDLNSTEVSGVDIYQGKPIKIVKVQIFGEEWYRFVGVTEDLEIIELPII